VLNVEGEAITSQAEAAEAVEYLDEVLATLLSPEEEPIITQAEDEAATGEDSSSEGAERRAHLRVPESQFIRFRQKNALASTLAVIGDLSEGGLFVRTPDLLLPGTLLEIDFNVENDGQAFLVRCRGQVAWVARDDQQSPFGPGFGIQFLSTPDEVSTLLKRIVENRLLEAPGSSATPAPDARAVDGISKIEDR
jgi:hypothetical protein